MEAGKKEKVREQKARYRQRKKKQVSANVRKWQRVDKENVKEYKTRYRQRLVLEKKLKKSHGVKELRVVLTDCKKPAKKKYHH